MYTVGDRFIQVRKYNNATVLVNQWNEILPKEDVLTLLTEVLETLKNKDYYEMILKEEKIMSLYHAGFNLRGKGRYYRSGNPVIKYKEFRKTIKRDWSFKCGWCNKKVSSKKDDGYFSIITFDPIHTQTPNDNYIRACSESCAKHLWDDLFKNWLKENDLWIDEILEMAGYQ